MLNTYFKIAFRNLTKHRFYTLINVFGLALGVACCIILFQFISYHLSFDNYHPNAKQIYKVGYDLHIPDGSIEYERGAPLILAKAIDTQVPQVKNSAILLKDRSFTVTVNAADGITRLFAENERIALTDGRYFKLFTYQWKQGDFVTALNQPNKAVLTANLAQKYFGTEDVVGKIITVDNRMPVTITGVLANNKPNTDMKEELFLSLGSFNQLYPDFAAQMQTDWNFINSHSALFVELPENVSPIQVEKTLTAIVNKAINQKESSYDYKLLPLLGLHFDGKRGGVIQKSMLITLGFVGFLLLAIACVNFINMATAQSTKRAKEIGTRKVLGSSSAAIFKQFITETGCIAALAILTAVVAVSLFLPVFNSWVGTQITLAIFSDYKLFLFLLAVLLLVILAAGFYPAMLLSRFKPVYALKDQVSANIKSTRFTRKGLIIIQNVIAQVLIICTLLITLQTDYLKNSDPGFDKNAIVMLPLPDHAKVKTDYLRNLLMAKPGVKNVSFCYSAAQSALDKGGSVKYDNREWENFTVFTKIGDAQYAKTFGLNLIAGRDIAESDSARQFLINEKLVQKLGVKNVNDVIGRRLVCGDLGDSEGTIVGVVKDFHSKSLYKPIDADLVTSSRDYYQFAAVKLSSHNRNTLTQLRNAWKSVYPASVFEYHFLDEQINDLYKKEDLLGKLIKASTAVAIMISCLGLLGLISLVTAQRVKEIGIRKVLGASVGQITLLLSKDFVKLVLVAIVIATPVAWLLMHNYLQDFAYHIHIPGWVFAATAVLSLMVAFVTTGVQSVKAALANPVKSLRDE
ncbi:hypothetical protein A0256_18520 [Mucilaginibacter sp. PAMC 26640]|nr:hypothetical protein A0256_18520 [Mucilaginibacter sp. PAMC 26640]